MINDYKVALEQSIYQKFPAIQNLNIEVGKDKMCTITFTEDDIHTEKEMLDFIAELQKLAKR